MKRVALLASLILVFSACSNRDRHKEEAGNNLITRVEQFRKQNGRLPSSAADVGIQEDESGPVYYRKESESRFVVWYGKNLGESVTYDSNVGRWEEHN